MTARALLAAALTAGVEGLDWRISTTRKIRTRLVDVDSGETITQAGRPGGNMSSTTSWS